MTFYFALKGDYKIGQKISVGGKTLQVESYSHTGKNLVAVSLPGAPRFIRAVVVLTDAASIAAIE